MRMVRLTFSLAEDEREKLVKLAAIRMLASGVEVSIAELAREGITMLLDKACKVETVTPEG